MSVAIIGSSGLLGQALVAHWETLGEQVYCVGRSSNTAGAFIDIEDTQKLVSLFSSPSLKYVINAAAYTDVDGAEEVENFDKVTEANTLLVLRLLLLLRQAKSNAVFFQVSSDYVTEPKGFYGYTKHLAELLTNSRIHSKVLVGRLTVLYGEQKGFVKWVYQQLKQGNQIKVVIDQVSCPTYNKEAAKLIGTLLLQYNECNCSVYSVCGQESMSRYEMAHRIARHYKLDANLIQPVRTADLEQKAPRPMTNVLHPNVPDFKYATLEQCLSEMDVTSW